LASARNSLIIPIFRNETNIPDLLEALQSLAATLSNELEVVFVDDASPDRSRLLIEEGTHHAPYRLQIVEHSRNFGSFAAITTGMGVAQGEYLAVMAADLQEPIELIHSFFEELAKPSVDIVVGARTGRNDGFLSGALSNTFWKLFRVLVDPEMPPGGVDVFGCSRQVADVIIKLPEANSSLVGLLYWVGFNRVEVNYERRPRLEGKSAWSLRMRFRYLSDSVFSFTTLPISLILTVGALGSAVAVVLSFAVFISWVLGQIPEPGFTTLALIQLGSTAAILLAIGVVGTYVWRTFDNSKRRPNAIVRR